MSGTQDPASPTRSQAPSSLRHVAELAEVSVATASRVMSGSKHPVSEKTRQRVLSAADRLSFEPNRLARALVTTRSQTVGVLVHDISDPYFGELVKGLEDVIHDQDYRLFVASSDRDPTRELAYVRAFSAHQVDSIIFAASSLTNAAYATSLRSLVDRFRSRGGFVVVLSDHLLEGPRVAFDNRQGVADMVEYLVQRGHQHIGFMNGPPDLEVSKIRLAGFKDAVATFGLDHRPGHLIDGHFTAAGGGDAILELRDRAPELTAVLAANDLMAIGATRRLQSSGLNVPDDLSIAGFDDIPTAEYAPVPLTTMRVPTYDIGKRGGELLLKILDGEDVTDVHIVGAIIERDSVAPPRHSE